MHAVAELVERIRAEKGWSDAEMVRRAHRAGHTISPSRWSQMMKGIKLFGGQHIDQLSAALDVPREVVVKALLASIGYELPDLSRLGVETAVRLDERLNSDDRAYLLALHRVMLSRRRMQRNSTDDDQSLSTSRLRRCDAIEDREPEYGS